MFNLLHSSKTKKLVSPDTLTSERKDKSLVLVLDDDIGLAKGLGLILKSKQMDSVVMYNSVDAYEFMRLKKVDLLITDLSIPSYGGKDLMSSINVELLNPMLPVIIYSGNLYPETIMELRKILKNHNYFFYEKPGSIDHLCNMARNMLKETDSSEEVKLQEYYI